MKTAALLVVLLSAVSAAVAEQSAPKSAKPAHEAHGSMISLSPDALEWGEAPAGLPRGAQAAVLEGDPGKSGYFAVRLKLPAGYKVPPHWHPGYERVTVIEGSFSLGSGEAFDESKLKTYPTGSYVSMPKGMRHFALAKDGAVIQIATLGPWGITYVNPSDDPRKQGAK